MTAAVRPFWIAFFGMVAASQLGHVAEHAAQIIQIHGLGMRAPDARGLLSALDTEWVHFVWNGWILVAIAALLVAYPRNRWLWLAAAFSAWHAFEHAYLFSGYLVTGLSGQPGLLASGGLVGGGLPLARPELHLAYNLAELVPLALAFRAVLTGRPGAVAARPTPRTERRRAVGAAVIGLAAVLLATGGSALTRTVPVATIDVANGTSLQAAIDAAPAGALIRVASGAFSGPLVVSRPLSLVGMADGSTQVGAETTEAVIRVVGTHDVTLAQLVITGGEYGVLVEESRAVRVLGSWIRDATFVGIRISRSAALLQGNEVRAGSGPYGMGIELANTMSQAHTLIVGNVVSGSTKEGIVLHNAEAMIEHNVVRGNGFRGIAINEMSMAMITGNTLRDNGDAGIAVVDHSTAEIDGNDIQGVLPGADGTAIGIRSFYYAEVSLGRNRIAVGAPTLAAAGGTFEAQASR